jgi:Phage capsid family
MPTVYSREQLAALEARRAQIHQQAEAMLVERRAQGVEQLDDRDSIRFRAMTRDISDLDEQIVHYRSELERSTIPERYRHLGQHSTPPPGSGRANCQPGSVVMPLTFGMEELRHAHEKVTHGEATVLETRASNTATPQLPAQLFPVPTFPVHEGRIADRLPAFALDAPSLEYVQVNSVTGAAAVTAEGAVKPEVTLNTTKLVATAVKIAAHLGLTQESIFDFDAFTSSANTELQRLVIDAENAQVLGWLNTAGILTHPAATGPNAVTFDDIEEAIAELRVGPSLATADLLVLNPATWSAIRREKDQQERYYVAPDPSLSEVSSVWGVPVVATTACPVADGWLLDTTKFGRLAVRETLVVRIGYSGDDFVRNVVRYVAEERCVLTVERPSAICRITGLTPTKSASKK